jgi:hypothetical protein
MSSNDDEKVRNKPHHTIVLFLCFFETLFLLFNLKIADFDISRDMGATNELLLKEYSFLYEGLTSKSIFCCCCCWCCVVYIGVGFCCCCCC